MSQSYLWLAAVITVAVALAAGAFACGPTQSTILINEAEVAFEKARLNEAEKKAPYEYHSAGEYLHKAKEEWGYSDFEAALDYAALSKQFSEEAIKKVKGTSDGMLGKDRKEKKSDKKGPPDPTEDPQ